MDTPHLVDRPKTFEWEDRHPTVKNSKGRRTSPGRALFK